MTRIETRRTTIIVLAIWILFAAFAAAALAQDHVATATSLSRCVAEFGDSDRNHRSTCAVSKATAMSFDVCTLPSLDSIGPQTNVAAFMQNGVPSEVQLAALRRAWSMDPEIRDFKGLQENDWDFDVADGVFGFGDLDPDFDVQTMIASMLSGPSRVVLAQSPTRPDYFYDALVLFVASWLRPAQGATRD
jgi:hypothetical protein